MFITVLEFLFAGVVIVYFIVMFVLAYCDDLEKEEKRKQAEKRNAEKRDLPHFVDIKDEDVNNYLKKEPTLNEEKSENNSMSKREILVKEYFNDWEEIQNDFHRKGR